MLIAKFIAVAVYFIFGVESRLNVLEFVYGNAQIGIYRIIGLCIILAMDSPESPSDSISPMIL